RAARSDFGPRRRNTRSPETRAQLSERPEGRRPSGVSSAPAGLSEFRREALRSRAVEREPSAAREHGGPAIRNKDRHPPERDTPIRNQDRPHATREQLAQKDSTTGRLKGENYLGNVD